MSLIAVQWSRLPFVIWAAVAGLGIAVPHIVPAYALHTFVLAFVWAIMAQSWNLVWGIAGVWSLGQMAIFAMAGYVTGWIVLHLSISPYVAAALGVAVAVAASVTMALPSLRLKGVYVILLTISFHEMFRILLLADTTGFTGGGFGLPPFAGFAPAEVSFNARMLIQYYTGLGLFIAVTAAVWVLLQSRLGVAFRAIGQDPIYATSRGISLFRTQVAAFAASGVLAGIAGAYYAQYFGTIQPGVLRYDIVVMVLAMIAIGGWGTFAGPIVGAFLLVWISEWLHDFQQFRMLIYGALIVIVSVAVPDGLMPWIGRRARALRVM